jgi:signal transduction histidine kinase
LALYSFDSSVVSPALPEVVVRPQTTAQVSEIARLCFEHEVPLITRGSGTNLAGSSIPIAGGCVLLMTRMNQVLEVNVEDLTVEADRGKVRLILENLLSNAIKYTPRAGTIHVRARATGAELVLEVGDSGPGVPPEERKQIFEAFYTGKAPGGHVKGTGIGLSVVMEFVTAHKGEISLVDGEWPGAHFRIRMPLRSGSIVQGESKGSHRKQAHAA